jgi:acetyl-CoA acyltransferase 1
MYCVVDGVGQCSAGMTSENVAAKYGVSRETQDKFAAQSHARMAAAQQAGKFDREIVPVATKLKVHTPAATPAVGMLMHTPWE